MCVCVLFFFFGGGGGGGGGGAPGKSLRGVGTFQGDTMPPIIPVPLKEGFITPTILRG